MNIEIFKRENTGSFSRIKIGKINVMDKKNLKKSATVYKLVSTYI